MTLIPNHNQDIIQIAHAVADFKERTGMAPNLLICGPNTDPKIYTRHEVLGLKVVVDDLADKDFEVAMI